MAGGCARADPSGLHVKGYAADIVFGAPKPNQPSIAGPPAGLTASQTTADVALPALPPIATATAPPTKFVGPPPAPRKVCPDATPGSAAAEPAAITVPDGARPAAGIYRWKKAGSLTYAIAPDLKLPVGGFEQRRVRNVKEVSTGVFSFETVQPALDGKSTVVTGWQVKPNATAQRSSNLSVTVTVGDPERGLTLKSVDTIDKDGKSVGFHPVTGLLVMPLPVVPGEQFSSVAIDPATQETMAYQATVGARDRIDACGQFVEGWQVTGKLSESSSSTPLDYSLWVAPQYGALPILERRDGSDAAVSYSLTYTLAQLHPDPDPAA